MVWQFSTVCTTICSDIIPLPFTICHLPFAILDNHSEIDCMVSQILAVLVHSDVCSSPPNVHTSIGIGEAIIVNR